MGFLCLPEDNRVPEMESPVAQYFEGGTQGVREMRRVKEAVDLAGRFIEEQRENEL